MSWTDRKSTENILKLRDLFNVRIFVETGTFRGCNAKLYSGFFDKVFTCEVDKENYEYSAKKLSKYENIEVINEDSAKFLRRLISDMTIIFYLDAHFYDPELDEKFVILRELEALRSRKNSIIIIHDFDNNLGHITYEGISLNFDLLKDKLKKINPNFKFYTNELRSCEIKPLEDAEDIDELENLKYVWSSPEKTFRGILYCIPEEVNIDGLKPFK